MPGRFCTWAILALRIALQIAKLSISWYVKEEQVLPHTLFLFHGMGVHGGDWAKSVVDALVEASTGFAYFSHRPLLDRLEIVPVRYDDVFQGYLDDWDRSASALAGSAQGQALDVTDLVTWLTETNETEKNFFWSHVVDVVMYRFFPQIRGEVRARVMSQLASRIELARQRGSRYSVLAHSLGTAVAHDSLHLLGTERLAGSTALHPPATRFDNLFALSNVSRCLRCEAPDVYRSIVKPGPSDSAESYLGSLHNFRNDYDPFSAVLPFAAEWDGVEGYHHHWVSHVRGWNVHGYEHYLHHPLVHGRIFQALFGAANILSTEIAMKAAVYKDAVDPASPCHTEYLALEQALKTLVDKFKDKDAPSIVELAQLVTETLSAGNAARVCEDANTGPTDG